MMEINTNSMATSATQSFTGDAVNMLVLKKAIQLEGQGALQLVQSLPQPAAFNNPSHLGQNVDVKA